MHITKADFKSVIKEGESLGQPTLVNARNAASGSLRLLDPALAAQRRLRFTAYQLLRVPNSNPDLSVEPLPATQSGALTWLANHGFVVNPDNAGPFPSFEAALQHAQAWREHRDELGYEVDGVVFKVDDLRLQEDLGAVGGDPR